MSSLFSVASATAFGGHQARSGGYKMQRSVRLRSSASAYFSRTPASAGNRKTWTWSAWVKRGALGSQQNLFIGTPNAGATDANYLAIEFTAGDVINFTGSVTSWRTTTQVFRDPSAHLHLIVALDTTQATASDRVKIYVNGSQVTAFSVSNNPTLNADLGVNQTVKHTLGARDYTAPDRYFDGYLTEINFIDGQALTPASFGQTDPYTGVWSAKRYAGTYGTNGFYLNFSDNSAATATAIGKDYSGNGNNWTPNNISVTAGATYDSMLDVPTRWADGGNGRGNYAVMSPIDNGGLTLTAANLNVSRTLNSYARCRSTIGMTTGKWFWEVTITSASAGRQIGVANESANLTTDSFAIANTWVYNLPSGDKYVNGSNAAYSGVTATTGDVIGAAFDADTGTLTMYKNGVSQGTLVSGLAAGTYFAVINQYGTGNYDFNFGQRPFAYTPPSGFRALNTQNLP